MILFTQGLPMYKYALYNSAHIISHEQNLVYEIYGIYGTV